MTARWVKSVYVIAAAASWAVAMPVLANPASDAAVKCRKAVTAKGKAYANQRRNLILGCLTKLINCDLKDETDPAFNPKTCRDMATTSCLAKLNTSGKGLLAKQGAFVDKTGLACVGHGIANMLSTAPGGLWFANDVDCGGSATITDLLTCLRNKIDAEVDKNLGRVVPRSGLLLDSIGIGDDFPNLPRPASTDVNLAATAPASGVLVSPGTIMVAAGNSVKFTGDSATLPCGMNANNGRVTIKVGTGTGCNNIVVQQERTLRETYGPGEVVRVGPFASDRIYCISLRDQSCNDEVSGTIDVTPDGADPTTAAMPLITCHKQLQGRVKTLTAFVANKLHTCADKVARCKLIDELDPAFDPTSCLAKATTACGAITAAIENKVELFKDKVELESKCTQIVGLSGFDELTAPLGGLGFVIESTSPGATCHGATTLSQLADCLLGIADTAGGSRCDAEAKTFVRDPRVVDSLTSVGLTPGTDFPCLAP
jgi:hypothetical protein